MARRLNVSGNSKVANDDFGSRRVWSNKEAIIVNAKRKVQCHIGVNVYGSLKVQQTTQDIADGIEIGRAADGFENLHSVCGYPGDVGQSHIAGRAVQIVQCLA